MKPSKLDDAILTCLRNLSWGCTRIATFVGSTPEVVRRIAKAHNIDVSNRP